MTFPTYPKYKDTGVDWLGDMPDHWQTKPLWALFRRTKRTGYSDERLLSVYRDYGVVPKDSRDDNNNKPSEDLSPYQLVQPGDLVINKMKAWQGSVAVSLHRGIVSPAYFVFEALHNENSRYLHYLLRSVRYITGYMTVSKGIRVNQWDLDPQYHATMPVLVPPIDEQTGIAKFLDRETAKIDDLVAEQERLIALLKEKRQVVISHAVTKGLNPDVPMKDSGVEWLGEIPEHWSVTELRRVTLDKCDGPFGSGLKSEHYVEEGVRVIRLQNIKSGAFDGRSAAFISSQYYNDELGDHSVEENDLLIAGLGDGSNPVGRACVAPNGIEPALVKADCFRFRLNLAVIVPDYAAHQLSISAFFDAGRLSSGTTRSRIPLSVMATRKVALPPTLEEQREIMELVGKTVAKIDTLVERAVTAIALLNERRSALISAAVTGKIDVRGLVDTEEAA